MHLAFASNLDSHSTSLASAVTLVLDWASAAHPEAEELDSGWDSGLDSESVMVTVLALVAVLVQKFHARRCALLFVPHHLC